MTYVMLLGGLVLLIGGAEVIVRYGTLLARRLGISPLIIGLTIVSIGTSAPELAAGIRAMTADSGNLLVGNVAGSNLMNLLLILGIAASIRAIPLQRQALRLDLPAMIVATLLTMVFALDGSFAVWEGVVLLAFALVYTGVLIRTARAEASAETLSDAVHVDDDDLPEPRRGLRAAVIDAILLVAGIAIVVVGADWLVEAAKTIAEQFGVSDSLIGLTIVAIGTSLPELATTTMATIRGARSLAVGNLIGSSTYNLTLILGTALLFAPGGSFVLESQLLRVDLPVLVVGSLLCVPVFLTGRRVSRREGVFFMGLYAAYFAYLIALRG